MTYFANVLVFWVLNSCIAYSYVASVNNLTTWSVYMKANLEFFSSFKKKTYVPVFYRGNKIWVR